MFNSGFIESGYDPNDLILDNNYKNTEKIPNYYDFTKFQGIKAKDQRNTMKCVPFSLSTMIESRKKLDGIDYSMNIDDIYDNRPGNTDGMMIRDALKYMKSVGFCENDKNNREKILTYGKLNSEIAIKVSIYMNGPCIMALPVYDSTKEDFWNGSSFEGGHAIACVGYDDEGFILMNSWGSGFGFGGKCVLPYTELNKIIECWTLILK